VTEVPMFAPMMIGIAPSMVNAPAATSPTVIEVVVEELWTSVVARIPMKSPTNGLEVRSISVSAKPLPKNLNEEPDERVGSPLDQRLRKALAKELEGKTHHVQPDEECEQKQEQEQNANQGQHLGAHRAISDGRSHGPLLRPRHLTDIIRSHDWFLIEPGSTMVIDCLL
jgi:hypothetical protein